MINGRNYRPILDKFGISNETIAEAAGIQDASIVENTISNSQMLNSFKDKKQNELLEGIIISLCTTIPEFLEAGDALILQKFINLKRSNISCETISAYTKIELHKITEFMAAPFTKQSSILSTDEKYMLIRLLMLLDDVLNKDEPFPWS